MRQAFRTAIVVAVFSPAIAWAHFPWFIPTGKGNTVDFVFEGGLRAADGQYLNSFIKNGRFWMRTPKSKGTTPLTFKEVKQAKRRWLVFAPKNGAPHCLEGYVKYGVHKGHLLHYYFKHLNVKENSQLASFGRSTELKFDLVPKTTESGVEVQVLWNGKPSPGKTVSIIGPKLKKTEKSDAKGIVRFPATMKGLYALRTQFIESSPAGKAYGEAYKDMRQTATITMNLPGAK